MIIKTETIKQRYEEHFPRLQAIYPRKNHGPLAGELAYNEAVAETLDEIHFMLRELKERLR